MLNVYQTSIKNNVLSISTTTIGLLLLAKTSLFLSTKSVVFEYFNPPFVSFSISKETRFSFVCVRLGLAAETISVLLPPLIFTIHTTQIKIYNIIMKHNFLKH
ncbi:hypothetical protein Hanom_Chr16g01505151 [Helianthus anomalus]